MRNVSGRELNHPHGTPRLFLGLEEMPVFSFHQNIAWASGGNMDLPSLAAYQSANGVLVSNLWPKEAIEQIARRWLAPSKVRELMPAIHECLPVKLERLHVAPRPMDGQLKVAFCGRMTGTRNFAEVVELFAKQFAYPLGKSGVEVKFIISTNSESDGAAAHGDISFVEVQHNDRAKFHELLKDVHVAVKLSAVEEFSLSAYEPLLFGVPLIVFDRPWTSFLGGDYPFRMQGFTQAYAMVSEFANNYAATYERFVQWEATTWRKLVEGPKNRTTIELVDQLLAGHQKTLFDRLAQPEAGAVYREIVADVRSVDRATTIDALKVAPRHGAVRRTRARQITLLFRERPNQYLLKPYMNMARLGLILTSRAYSGATSEIGSMNRLRPDFAHAAVGCQAVPRAHEVQWADLRRRAGGLRRAHRPRT